MISIVFFLGEYTSENKIKVFEKNTVKFVDKDFFSSLYEYETEEFLDVMETHDLYFIVEGDEPFWQLKLEKSKLSFLKYDLNKEIHFESEIYVDKQSGFNIMFKSKDNTTFGLVRKVDPKLNKIDSCSLGLTENYTTYQAFITYKGVMYKGCCTIEKKIK